MEPGMVDALRYMVGSFHWGGPGWERVVREKQIFAYRGRFSGFIRVTASETCKPWCGVCQRPVDRCTVEETLNVARVKAYCHRRMQVVEVPWGYVRSGQRFELGVAFWGGPQPRCAT